MPVSINNTTPKHYLLEECISLVEEYTHKEVNGIVRINEHSFHYSHAKHVNPTQYVDCIWLEQQLIKEREQRKQYAGTNLEHQATY